MKKSLLITVCCLFAVTMSAQKMAPSSTAPERRGGWFALGDTYAVHNTDHDAIQIKESGANFKRIKVTVRDLPLTITRMTLVYDTGENETLDFPMAIAKNGESETFDINTDGRNIKRIDFWYDSADFKKGKAEVTVFARR